MQFFAIVVFASLGGLFAGVILPQTIIQMYRHRDEIVGGIWTVSLIGVLLYGLTGMMGVAAHRLIGMI